MKDNLNKSNDSFDSSQGQNRGNFVIFHQAQPLPITTPPQQFSRSLAQMFNNTSNRNSENVFRYVNFGRPNTHFNEAHGSNSALRPKSSDQRRELNPQDSVVINFDGINEPSSSSSPDLYRPNGSRTLSDQYNLGIPALDFTENNHQNLSNDSADRIVSLNNDFNNRNTSNNNAAVTQSNEGGQPDDQNLTQNSRNQSIEKVFNKYIPFIIFILLKAIYDHREGILIFVALLVTFFHANSVVKREVAKQSRRSLLYLGIIFVNLFVSICFINFVFQEQQLYKTLIFVSPHFQPLNIWDLLWMVGITDFVLKFITIQLKVGMTCFPAKLLPYSARGKWYLMLERGSQLYRGLVPIQPWLSYLLEAYKDSERVGLLFSVAYMVSKGSDITSKAKLFLKAFWKLLQNSNLGVRPSKEQLITAGSNCPICHDEYNSPIILQCSHVFCEGCVSVWFDREQTCPLCRAKIADDPSWRDGSTSLFPQLF